MATAAKSSFGTYLKIGDGGTAETFATIAEVLDISGPELTQEVEDVTSHDSTEGWVERIGTLLDGGAVSFKINFIAAHATHSASAGLLNDLQDRTKRNFQLVIPAASSTTWSFAALVTKASFAFPVKGAQQADIELMISGKVTLA